MAKVIDITSAFIGVTTPPAELYQRIAEFGWDVDSLDFKKNYYVVKASNEHGEKVELTGNTEATVLGNLLKYILRMQSMRAPFNERVAAYHDSFVDLQEEIAHEYVDAKYYDKKAAEAWMELAEDCRRRVEIIKDEIDIEITDNPIPYKSYSELAEDITEKGHFFVSRANVSHPIWNTSQVLDFRIAHDILGHAASSGDWTWFGINRAFQAHASLLSYTAQKALFTEVIGQGAANSYYKSYNPQKIVFLKIFDNPDNPEPYHHPVHPSQTVVPGPMAKIPYEKTTSVIDEYLDPNYDYSSGLAPVEQNAYLWHRVRDNNGNMTDPLNSRELDGVIKGIRSNWHELDPASQEQAVANAFRHILLKPGQTERGRARHYQAINHIPGSVDDPMRYWDALTHAQRAHNDARGYLDSGKELDIYKMPLRRHILNLDPNINHGEISNLADRHLLEMRAEEEREAKKKFGPGASAQDINREALKRLIKRLNKATNIKAHEDFDFDQNRLFFSNKHPDSAIYDQPMAHCVQSIADVCGNIKEITQAALDDLSNGGKGHHFRLVMMNQDFAKDIGIDQIDEAWFYLAPETSQLGIIGPEVLKSLGNKDKEISLRDYFKAERELHAARDASGYGHMPLGQFSKALKNIMYQSTGHHPNKNHFHLIYPLPHTEIDWDNRDKKLDKPRVPSWFNETKKLRKEIARMWDRLEGINYPKDAIPFRKRASGGFSTIFPFFTHPDTNEKIKGRSNQSLMQHIIESMGLDGNTLSTPEIWVLNPEVGKEVVNDGN